MTEVSLHCRVCGLQQSEPPWGADGRSPTFEICPCCGVEFGYEDVNETSALQARNAWLANGARWTTPTARPADWDVEVQLRQLGASAGTNR